MVPSKSSHLLITVAVSCLLISVISTLAVDTFFLLVMSHISCFFGMSGDVLLEPEHRHCGGMFRVWRQAVHLLADQPERCEVHGQASSGEV